MSIFKFHGIKLFCIIQVYNADLLIFEIMKYKCTEVTFKYIFTYRSKDRNSINMIKKLLLKL